MQNIYEDIDNEILELDDDELREAYVGYFKNSFPFLLCPAFFNRVNDLPMLNWQSVKYNNHLNHVFPDSQGVYIFLVNIDDNKLPVNAYVMYVGKAGDVNSDNTIAKRFRDYVNRSGYFNRSRIKKLIKHFSEHLTYCYAVVPNGQSTAEIEQALADIFSPPCCQVDFSPEARGLIRGIRL